MICQVKIVDSTTGTTIVKKKFFSDKFDAAQYIQEYLGWEISTGDVRDSIDNACEYKVDSFRVQRDSRTAKVKFLEH